MTVRPEKHFLRAPSIEVPLGKLPKCLSTLFLDAFSTHRRVPCVRPPLKLLCGTGCRVDQSRNGMKVVGLSEFVSGVSRIRESYEVQQDEDYDLPRRALARKLSCLDLARTSCATFSTKTST